MLKINNLKANVDKKSILNGFNLEIKGSLILDNELSVHADPDAGDADFLTETGSTVRQSPSCLRVTALLRSVD